MNFGTPQEMIDEEREYYESMGKKPPSYSCTPLLLIIIVISLMIIFL